MFSSMNSLIITYKNNLYKIVTWSIELFTSSAKLYSPNFTSSLLIFDIYKNNKMRFTWIK